MKKHATAMLIAGVVLLGASGCAPLHNVSVKQYRSKDPSQSMVVGKINIKQRGAMGFRTRKWITVVNKSNGKGVPFLPATDKYFFLPMEPGEYFVEDIHLGYGFLGMIGYGNSVPIGRRFEVKPNETVYIGDMTIKVDFITGAAGLGIKNSDVLVADNYDIAVSAFRARYQDMNVEVSKRLLER
jgi:hypothetical protein